MAIRTVTHTWFDGEAKPSGWDEAIAAGATKGRSMYRYEFLTVTTHEGCVVAVGEHNGYHDSDFYATVWNGETFVKIMYATTRAPTYDNHAWVDASDELLEKYRAYLAKIARAYADARNFRAAQDAAEEEARKARREARREEGAKEVEATEIAKGTVVTVLRGKYKGACGTVFWLGATNGGARCGVNLEAHGTQWFNLGQVAAT